MITLFDISLTVPFCFIIKTSLKKAISRCSLLTAASSFTSTSLRLTLYITFLARSANFSVEVVSSTLDFEGLTVAIRIVFVPPENESCKSLVKLESLNGTNALPFASNWITLPRVVKDKLMFLSSAM